MTTTALSLDSIRRLHYGYIVAPEGRTDVGQPIPVCGYLVEHPKARILFDTGLAPVDEATRARYRPRATTPGVALAALGLAPGDIDLAGLDTIGKSPAWMARVAEFDPIRTYFAHDLLVHERDEASLGIPQPL